MGFLFAQRCTLVRYIISFAVAYPLLYSQDVKLGEVNICHKLIHSDFLYRQRAPENDEQREFKEEGRNLNINQCDFMSQILPNMSIYFFLIHGSVLVNISLL